MQYLIVVNTRIHHPHPYRRQQGHQQAWLHDGIKRCGCLGLTAHISPATGAAAVLQPDDRSPIEVAQAAHHIGQRSLGNLLNCFCTCSQILEPRCRPNSAISEYVVFCLQCFLAITAKESLTGFRTCFPVLLLLPDQAEGHKPQHNVCP